MAVVAQEGAPAGLGQPSRRFRSPELAAPATTLPDTIHIGMVTTTDDALRESRVRGASLAIAVANRAGGCRDVPVTLRLGRVESPWMSAADVARDLLCEEDCLGLITPPDGAVAHLLEQVATRGHVPLVSLSSESSLTRVPVPWLVRVVPDVRAQVEALLAALPPPLPPAVPALVPSGRDGRQTRRDLLAVGRRHGIAFVPVLECEPQLRVRSLDRVRERDPLPRARRLEVLQGLRHGPVVVWLTGDTALRALAQLASVGWQGPVLVPRELSEGGGAPSSLPPGLAYMTLRLFDPEDRQPVPGAFVRAFRGAYGVAPDEAAACAYDAAALLIDAIGHAGASRSAIRARLANIEQWRGVSGELHFDGTGNRENAGVVRFIPAGGGEP